MEVTFDWHGYADSWEEQRLRRHRRCDILVDHAAAKRARLCGTGILSWRKATGTKETARLPAMDVVRRTIEARPSPNDYDDYIQFERAIAEWCQWCMAVDSLILHLKRERRRQWWRNLFRGQGSDGSPATVRRTRTGPRAGLPGLPRHQRTQATPRSQ